MSYKWGGCKNTRIETIKAGDSKRINGVRAFEIDVLALVL